MGKGAAADGGAPAQRPAHMAAAAATGTRGLALQAGSTTFVAGMSILTRIGHGSYGLPVMQLVLARSLVLLAVAGVLLARAHINPLRSARWAGGSRSRWCSGVGSVPARTNRQPTTARRLGLLALRGLLGFGAVTSLYFSVTLLPLADAAVLAFLAPVLVAALSPLLLREPPSRGVAAALPLSLVGVLLVAQPTFLFGGAARALSAAGVAVKGKPY